MQIENHKEEVPFSHYAGLFRDLDPQEALNRLPSAHFSENTFFLTLLGRDFAVSWPEAKITPEAPIPMQTFILRILLEGKEIPFTGEYKTFREMPWGEMYIKPYTGRVLTRAAFSFGTQIEKFRSACEKLGAVPLKHGDAGFRFDFFGPYTLEILIWEGDDEFPPNAQLLYSDNFGSGFAAEDRVVAGDLLIGHIKSAM